MRSHVETINTQPIGLDDRANIHDRSCSSVATVDSAHSCHTFFFLVLLLRHECIKEPRFR